MKWLVVFNRRIDRETLQKQLRDHHCEILADDRSMSVGEEEEVLSVEGPANLPRLAESFEGTLKIYPNSRMGAY